MLSCQQKQLLRFLCYHKHSGLSTSKLELIFWRTLTWTSDRG
nr:MAG TPA: Putative TRANSCRIPTIONAL REGULATOR-Independent Response Regulator, H [Caudoviricetes sp.]